LDSSPVAAALEQALPWLEQALPWLERRPAVDAGATGA